MIRCIKYITFLLLLVLVFVSGPSSSFAQDSTHTEGSTLRTVPDSVVEKVKSLKDFAYANDPEYWKQEQDTGWLKMIFGILGSSWMKVLLYIFFGTLLLFVLYRVLVVQGIFNLKSKKVSKKIDTEGEEFWQETVESLEGKIREAERHQDYRKAVRYSFLQALRLLDNKNMIRFDSRSTNSDYVRQLSGTRYADQFSLLTRIYDFVWYGEVPVSDLQYNKVQANFQQLKDKIS